MIATPHDVHDAIALDLARLAAARILEDPSRLQEGLNRLQRWRAMARGPAGKHASFSEWEELIRSRTPDEIAEILLDQREEGRRLRSSMPFIRPPFFTEEERLAIVANAFKSQVLSA